MEPIKLSVTSVTPKVSCDEDGTVLIVGKSFTEDPFAFYKPIQDWIEEVKAENLVIGIQLEYMNTSSSIQIYNVLKLAKENHWRKTILIKWFYEANDEDGLELGKEYESMLEIPFEFYEIS